MIFICIHHYQLSPPGQEYCIKHVELRSDQAIQSEIISEILITEILIKLILSKTMLDQEIQQSQDMEQVIHSRNR